MNEEKTKIYNMLQSGRITAEEADRLLEALKQNHDNSENESKTSNSFQLPRFLYVRVDSENGEKVNVKVPIKLITAGMKLTSLIPDEAQVKINEAMHEKGINFDLKNLNQENISEIIDSLRDLEINVNDKGEKVTVYCE